jgi:phosphoribosylformylglycinamidine synthase PurS subunit
MYTRTARAHYRRLSCKLARPKNRDGQGRLQHAEKWLSHCYNAVMKAHVWVMPKRTVLDPQGQTIQHALSGLGYKQISDVRQGKFFVLNLDGWSRDEAQSQLERISKEVLTNPVIEEYRFEIVD